ncbi:MAG TPA: HEAT repeat domain-containing protein [Tepidisphaeraceae bacterium]|nr:HEAT repeat domain-containing protein [Tepidisphaeraceae bacterium]
MGSKRVVCLKSGPMVLLLGVALLSAIGCQNSRPNDQTGVVANTAGPHDPVGQHHVHGPQGSDDWLDDDEVPDGLLGVALDATITKTQAAVVSVVDGTSRLANRFSGENASQAVRLLEDPTSADNRRVGMNKLVEYGFLKHETPIEKKTSETFEKRCRQIAQFDTDFTVRATAVRTENRARDTRATPIFIADLVDKNEMIRLEAAKALVNVPEPGAAPALIAALTDHEESRDVRVAAADALKHYRTLPVERALSSVLHDRSFAVAWQARRSLEHMTLHDFLYDEAAWLSYFAGDAKAM